MTSIFFQAGTKLAVICGLVLQIGGLAAQSFKLGEGTVLVPKPDQPLPTYVYSPDGHVTLFPWKNNLLMFWPGSDSYTTTGKTILKMDGVRNVLPKGGAGDFDNGGAWLYSVFPKIGERMIGFYHAEDHHFVKDPASTFIAYKSIARCESKDGGRSWKKDLQILTSAKPKPENPEWSGLGDHCTIWDSQNRRYICYFQEGGILCMASSSDPEGKPGTWLKWFEGEFTEPGLGGKATPIPNLAQVEGGNPSVHWNTYLQNWVMVYHTWTGKLVMSQSKDLTTWSVPVDLLVVESSSKVWYATVIGETDAIAGEKATLIYAYFPDINKHEREFLSREITFLKSP